MYFENIIGQNLPKRYMTNSINNNKISHAYMFEGGEGIGKKEFAKEFASILMKSSNIVNNPDYIEIKPEGSSIKISQIRKLQSDIVIKPHSEYKIYVILNSDKMTLEAQNAILKTLEEPPKYAIIILIANNKEALLDTIKSRCEIIKFTPISEIDLKKYLIKQDIDEQRASIAVSFSRGSIDKALELSKSSDFSIMREDIQQYIDIILEKDLFDILNTSNIIDKYKGEIHTVLDVMINYFRDVMILKEKIYKDTIINGDRITFVQNINKKISYSQVTKIIDIIEDIKKKLRSNCNFNISMQVMALNIYEVVK